jgi:hypothetical protein
VIGEDLCGSFRVIGEGILTGLQLDPGPTNEPIIGRRIGLTWHRPKDFKIIRCRQYVGWEGINSDDPET